MSTWPPTPAPAIAGAAWSAEFDRKYRADLYAGAALAGAREALASWDRRDPITIGTLVYSHDASPMIERESYFAAMAGRLAEVTRILLERWPADAAPVAALCEHGPDCDLECAASLDV